MTSSAAAAASSSPLPPGLRFWKPGTIAPGSSVERDDASEIGDAGLLLPPPPVDPSLGLGLWSGAGGVGQLSARSRSMLLPVSAHRRQILYALEKHQVLVLVAETGSGKSSQVPQMLLDAGWCARGGLVGVTQPRRVAATSLATRVAQERGEALGDSVGYAVRFDEVTSPATRILFLTDGLLLRETLRDPLLSRYSVIMVDEAHERSVPSDVLLALLRHILHRRPELRLVLSSATLDAERLLDYFQTERDDGSLGACILTVQGRQYPVEVFYSSQPVQDYVRASVDTVLHIARTQPAGDILVFLTGREEIERVCELLREESDGSGDRGPSLNLRILPLYAGLSVDRQADVFAPAPYAQRKVVVSTNVAEASVTIDGIGYVVDAGFAKMRYYDPRTATSHLIVAPISQSSATQRSGRAGRTSKGVAYRLYTEAAFHSLPARTPPELQRCSLVGVMLQLKALGIDGVLQFGFLDPPPLRQLSHALDLLLSLGAVDANAQLTHAGRLMADMPLEPNLARMLLASGGIGNEHAEQQQQQQLDANMGFGGGEQKDSTELTLCSDEVLSIAAMLSVEDVFLTPSHARSRADACRLHFAVHEGDHLTLLNVFNAFLAVRKSDPVAWCHRNFLNFKALGRAVEIRKQLRRLLQRHGVPIVSSNGDGVAIRKAVLSGFFMNVAQLQADGSYRAARAPTNRSDVPSLHIHPSSVLHATTQSAAPKPQWLVYHQLVYTNKLYMRDISVVDASWLTQIAPHFYEFRSGLEDERRRFQSITDSIDLAADDDAKDTDGVRGEPGKKHRRLF